MKPHIKLHIASPKISDPNSIIQRARLRFGQKFAFEPGSTWKPRETPLLDEWKANRIKEKV